MQLSGVLVVTRPDRLERCRREIESIAGVEVHYVEPASGRAIAVIESRTRDGQERRLREIQALPDVRYAALVEHRISPDDEPPTLETGG